MPPSQHSIAICYSFLNPPFVGFSQLAGKTWWPVQLYEGRAGLTGTGIDGRDFLCPEALAVGGGEGHMPSNSQGAEMGA